MSLMRPVDRAELAKRIGYFPATAILGPRQCGKTTLARELNGDHFFDLENPRDLVAFDAAQTLLESLDGLVVIDDVVGRGGGHRRFIGRDGAIRQQSAGSRPLAN